MAWTRAFSSARLAGAGAADAGGTVTEFPTAPSMAFASITAATVEVAEEPVYATPGGSTRGFLA